MCGLAAFLLQPKKVSDSLPDWVIECAQNNEQIHLFNLSSLPRVAWEFRFGYAYRYEMDLCLWISDCYSIVAGGNYCCKIIIIYTVYMYIKTIHIYRWLWWHVFQTCPGCPARDRLWTGYTYLAMNCHDQINMRSDGMKYLTYWFLLKSYFLCMKYDN